MLTAQRERDNGELDMRHKCRYHSCIYVLTRNINTYKTEIHQSNDYTSDMERTERIQVVGFLPFKNDATCYDCSINAKL